MSSRFAILSVATMMTLAICVFATDSQSPNDLLKSKQLTKFGAYYLLDVDAKLPQSLRDIRKADAQLDNYTKRRHFLEDEIEKTANQIIRWGHQVDAIHEQLSHTATTDTQNYNNLVNQVTQGNTSMLQAAKYGDQCNKDLQALPVPPDSTQQKIDLLQSMQKAAKQYDDLAKDADVQSALTQLSQNSGVKFRLGPSAQFKSELAILQREHDKLITTPIKLEFEGGVPQVQAVLNGSTNQAMIVDSGAAHVVLSSAVAAKVGLQPGPHDPQIVTVDANGKQTTCSVMTLASLRVGPFVVNNVECVILPVGEDASCLLGGTFLHNFLYRMDLGTGQLFLTPVAGAAVAEKTSTSSDSTSTTKPASQSDTDRVTLEIAATIDGSDVVNISSEGLNWTHKDWGWPTDVYVNGDRWNPQAGGLPGTGGLAFLRKVDFSTARTIDKTGRGSVSLTIYHAGLEVDFSDPEGGADQYDIKISIATKK